MVMHVLGHRFLWLQLGKPRPSALLGVPQTAKRIFGVKMRSCELVSEMRETSLLEAWQVAH